MTIRALIPMIFLVASTPVHAVDSRGTASPDPGVAFLPTTPTWFVTGSRAYANMGVCVAAAGDVNGDGYDDVIVGADDYGSGHTDGGRAFVYHGSPSGLSTTPAWTAAAHQAGAAFGSCVAPAGDVNGDGYDDVLVVAPEFDNGQFQEGKAFLYQGSSVGLSASPAWTFESNQAFAFMGAASTAGDVNGDGYDDVVVGARNWASGETAEGIAWVFMGAPTGLGSGPAWTRQGGWDHARFGSSVATAGDINNDGRADVIIGAPTMDGGDGAAYVFLGTAAGVSPTAVWTGHGASAGAAYGTSVASAGDLNGDGFGDIAVGSPEFYYPPPIPTLPAVSGAVDVHFGAPWGLSTEPQWQRFGDGGDLGHWVMTAGDANDDGYDDLLIGAPVRAIYGVGDMGAIELNLGGPSGPVSPVDWITFGDQPGCRYGQRVSTAGDVNGDGYDDVIVGAAHRDEPYANAGRAYVFHGAPGGPAAAPWRTADGTLQLSPATPNPFTSRTALTFVVPAAGRGALHIYDPAGRRIRTLLDGRLAEGRQTVVWDGGDDRGHAAAPGLYVAELRYEDMQVTRKVLLTR